MEWKRIFIFVLILISFVLGTKLITSPEIAYRVFAENSNVVITENIGKETINGCYLISISLIIVIIFYYIFNKYNKSRKKMIVSIFLCKLFFIC